MILCCGEALIDMLPRETAAGEMAFQPFIGGSVYNTAIALARLGEDTGFFGGLSTDFFGEMLMEGLAGSGADSRFAALSDRPTTLAFVKFVDGQPRYAFIDQGSAGRLLGDTDLPALPDGVTALHCGSFMLAAEPCGSTFETLIERERERRVVVFDPNVRASLVADRGRYLARVERFVAMADIVKLSDEDMAWLAPGAGMEEFAAGWLDRGAGLVIVTAGDEGPTAFTAAGTFRRPPVAVRLADTIGAGDTFTAGLLSSLTRQGCLDKAALAELGRERIETALDFAARAAAVTVSRTGCNPPWRNELEAG